MTQNPLTNPRISNHSNTKINIY